MLTNISREKNDARSKHLHLEYVWRDFDAKSAKKMETYWKIEEIVDRICTGSAKKTVQTPLYRISNVSKMTNDKETVRPWRAKNTTNHKQHWQIDVRNYIRSNRAQRHTRYRWNECKAILSYSWCAYFLLIFLYFRCVRNHKICRSLAIIYHFTYDCFKLTVERLFCFSLIGGHLILTLFVRVVNLWNTFYNLRCVSVPMYFHPVKKEKEKKNAWLERSMFEILFEQWSMDSNKIHLHFILCSLEKWRFIYFGKESIRCQLNVLEWCIDGELLMKTITNCGQLSAKLGRYTNNKSRNNILDICTYWTLLS